MSTVRTIDHAPKRTSVGPMKRRGVTGKLATVRDLAGMLNVTRARAYIVSNHWSFPTPVDVLSADSERPMAVWWRKDVEKWVQDNPDAVKHK